MRRFVTSVVLLLFAIPFGASLSGCHHAVAPDYCNGENSGVQVGQTTTVDLEPRLTGISLNQGEIGQANQATAKDCRGNTSGGGATTYASTNMTLLDIVPTSGRLCAGTWNRNTGGGIPDYTTCIPNNLFGTAYITASIAGVVSNPIPVYVHPIVTSISLGGVPSNCATDPASDCTLDATQPNGCSVGAPPSTYTVGTPPVTLPLPAPYLGLACVSQGQSAQFVARAFAAPAAPFSITSYFVPATPGVAAGTIAAGTPIPTTVTFQTGTQNLFQGETIALSSFPVGNVLNGQNVTVLTTDLSLNTFQATITLPAAAAPVTTSVSAFGATPANLPNNISCLVGPLSFSASNASVVSISTNGLATAAAPGATIINAATSQASSTAGLFSTCPPASIILSAAGAPAVAPTAPITVNQNTVQSFVVTATDTAGSPLTNLGLTYVSTNPTIIPAQANTVAPPYPGSTAITAVCQPPSCNYSPFNEIGLYGNGLLVTSNPVQVNSIGTNFNTVLYMASSNSQYLLPIDFTLTTQSVPIRLPYAPNSFVLSTDTTTIYMGTANELMVFSTGNNSLSREDTSVSGTVLGVSPDSNTVVITDPVRKLVYLYNQAGSITAEYGGVATRTSFSPDSSTTYITTTDGRLLVYSIFTGWTSIPLSTLATDVTVTVPNAGAYLAETTVADVRSACPITTVNGTGINQTTTNVFYPSVGPVAAAVNRVLSTNDGLHIFGANNTGFTDIVTNKKTGVCYPAAAATTFVSNPKPLLPFTTAVPTSGGIANIFATSDSAYGFVTFGTPTAALPTGTGGVIPQYNPATSTLTNIPLQTASGSAAPGTPVSAVISGDNNILFVGTTGDNLVHRLSRGTNGFTDILTPINPMLPAFTGTGNATPNFLAQKPRRSTT